MDGFFIECMEDGRVELLSSNTGNKSFITNVVKVKQKKNKISLFTLVRQKDVVKDFCGSISYTVGIVDTIVNADKVPIEPYTFYIDNVKFDDEIIHIDSSEHYCNYFEYVFVKEKE